MGIRRDREKEEAVFLARRHGSTWWVVWCGVDDDRAGCYSLAHRHWHASPRGDGKRSLARLADVSDVDLLHGLVQGACWRDELADPTPADLGQHVDYGEVQELHLVMTEDEDANLQGGFGWWCIVEVEVFFRSRRCGAKVD